MKGDCLEQKRCIADAAFGSLIDSKTLRPPELAIYQQKRSLKRKSATQSISNKKLTHRTILVLSSGIPDFVPIDLHGGEVSELFADAAKPAIEPGKWRWFLAVLQHLHLRGVASAEITRFNQAGLEQPADRDNNC